MDPFTDPLPLTFRDKIGMSRRGRSSIPINPVSSRTGPDTAQSMTREAGHPELIFSSFP